MNKLQFKISFIGSIIIAAIIASLEAFHNEVMTYDEDLILVIELVIFCSGLIFTTLFFRKKRNEKIMTYGKSFGTCFLITILSALLISSYEFIYQKFIDPVVTEEISFSESALKDANGNQVISEQDYRKREEAYQFIKKPVIASIIVFITYVFSGLIIALISSIFIKQTVKQRPENNILDSDL
ncbi:MAG: DUF4199 domain-containing protein [Bacteroidia bacterium]